MYSVAKNCKSGGRVAQIWWALFAVGCVGADLVGVVCCGLSHVLGGQVMPIW